MENKYEKGDEIRVTWKDPETDSGWFDEEDMPELEEVFTSGIFLKEDEEHLWMASTYHKGTGCFADRMTFPKSIILDIKKLW